MGKSNKGKETVKRLDPPQEERRKYLKTVGALAAGLVVGGAAGWLSKPAERVEVPGVTVTERITETVTKTVTAPVTPTSPPITPTPAKIHVTLVSEPKVVKIRDFLPELKDKTGVDVYLESLPYPTLEERQMIELSGRTGALDIVHVDCVWVGRYAAPGWTLPIDDLVERDKAELDLDDWVWRCVEEQGMWEGKIYGFPFITAVHACAYRTDIFEEFGLTEKNLETWDDLYETCKLLKPELEKRGMYPLSFMGKRGVQCTCNFFNFIGSYGGQIYSGHVSGPLTYEPQINSPEVLEGLEMLCKLKEVADPSVIDYDWDECMSAFGTGRTAINLQWTNAYPSIIALAHPDVMGPPRKWDATFTPGVRQPDGTVKHTPCFGGWSLQIPADSKNREAAWEFMKWATSPEMDVRLAPYQDPGRKSAFLNPEMVKKFFYFPLTMKSLEMGFGRPRIPPWPEMSDAMGREVNAALVGLKTPKQALDDLQAEYERILREAGFWKG
jgi:ABC-type glycerol-3-phosphate transport system substrate-binding protein